MKKILYLYAAVLLGGGCAGSMNEPGSGEEGAFRFAGYGAAENGKTRTGYVPGEEGMTVAWREGDAVALFCKASAGTVGYNKSYRALPDEKDAAKCRFYPSESSDMIPWVSDEAVDFYGCYPYREVEGPDPGSYPVSLPSIQTQAAAGDTDHLGGLCFMKAEPVRISTAGSGSATVNLAFHNVFAVVELSLRLAAGATIDVPVKEIRLTSRQGAGLALPSASIDLTAPIGTGYDRIPLAAAETSGEIRLLVESGAVLTAGGAAKFYFVAAPGEFADGDLELEIVAIDNSTAKVTLPGAVAFLSNRIYRKSVEVADTDFIPANPFDVVQKRITVAAGQDATFDFEGMADRIVFYSGEEGYDYAYSEKDRMTRAEKMHLSFSMRSDPTGSNNSFNPRYAALEYSTDFSGIFRVEEMDAATWTDLSSNFTLPTEPKVLAESGVYDIAPLFPVDQDTIYIRFDYRFEKGTNSVGRSIVVVKDFLIEAEYPDETPYPAYDLLSVGWKPLFPDPNAGSSQVVLPGAELRFSASSWKPSAAGQAWAVAKIAIYRFNRGRDQYAVVKEYADVQPLSYRHVYPKPGTYKAVFVVQTQTLMGEKSESIPVEITVTQ